MPKKPSAQPAPQQPVDQVAPPPQQESWTPPPNLHEAAGDPKAPADILHNLATHAIDNPDDEHSSEIISNLSDNPSIQPHTVTALYNHLKGKNDEAEHDAMFNLASHPNAPALLAEQHVQHMHEAAKRSNYGHTARNSLNKAILSASKKSGVDEDMLKRIVKDYVDNDVADEYAHDSPIAHVDPAFYMQMLLERPEMHPEAEHLTPEEIAHNSRVKRIDATALKNLAVSEKHTPETLSAFAQYLAQPARYGQGRARWKQEFIQRQKQIPTEHLDRLYNHEAEFGEREANNAILEHPNVSPTLLASVARSEGEGYHYNELKSAAFAHPNLPDEVIRAVVDSPNASQADMRMLISNPKLSADDMRKLYERGDVNVKKKTVLSENAPDDLKIRHWQASDKSTDAARTMLESKTLPAQVLKDIVNHKNQNVAVEALSHPSANEEVLEAAVKRKAAAVADAAARHPLLAGKYFDQRVREGKMKGSELFFNKENRQAVPPEKMAEYTRIMHERYRDSSEDNISKLKENKEDFYKVKVALSQSPELTQSERDHHLNDIAAEYRRVIPPTWESWRAGQDSHAQTMARSVIDGAKRGHEKSEEALLTTPQMVSSANFSEGHRPEFLSKVVDSLPDRSAASKTVREIASNPVTPEDTFQRITSDRDFFQNPGNYTTGRLGEQATVFDDRWANDPQRDQKFQALTERPEARPAVVMSNSVPKDTWRKAFEGMNDTDRLIFLSGNADHAVKMADDELFTRMLNGGYNGEIGSGRYGRSHNHVQVTAFNKAGPNFADDIVNYIATSAHPDAPDNIKMDPKDFADSLNDEIYDHPSFENIQNAAFISQPSLGVELRAKKLLKEAKTYPSERFPEILNRYIDHLRNDATDGMTPEQKKMAFGDRIHSMVEALRDYGRSYNSSSVKMLMLKAKPKETGALDFLADGGFSADPDIDSHIRSLAISGGLISDKKIAEVMNASPISFEESLRALRPIEKAERIRQALGGADVHPDLLDPIVAHLTNATLNPAYKDYHYRGDTKPKHVTTASQLAMNLGRRLALDGQFGNIGAAAAKILKDSISPDRGGMRKDDRIKVMKALQQGAEAAAPQAKGQIAAWIYKTAHQMGVDEMLPGSMANTLAKEALKNNDVETLFHLADTPNPPSNITNAITHMVSKTELLSDVQMRTVPYLLQKIQVTPKAVRKVVDAYLSRPTLQESKNDLYSGLRRMIEARKYTTSAQAQDIEGEVIRAASMDPTNETAQKSLCSIARRSNYHANVKAAYLALPDRADHLEEIGSIDLNQQVANDPEVMQKSHSGWRLGALVRSIHSLNKENRSILADRLSLYQGDDIGLDRPEAYKKIVMAPGTASDDCVKLYRYMNPQEKSDFLNQLSDSVRGGHSDYNVDGVAAMMPHVAADMKEDAEKVPVVSDEYEDHEAVIRVSKSIEGAAGLATKLAKTLANNKSNDSKSFVQDYAGEVLSSAEVLADKISYVQRSDPNFYKGTAATSARSLMHALSHVASTKDHAGLSSQKMLDVFSKVRDVLSEAMGTRDPKAPGAEQVAVFAANWIENAKVQPEHWADAFKKIPEMQFYASGRENIEPEMYKAFNIKQMIEAEPKDAFETFSTILTKLDPIRAHEVVPDMLDKVEQNIGASERAITEYRRSYSQLVLTAVDRHPSTLTARHLREILGREGIHSDSRKRIEGIAYDKGAGGREFFDQGLKEMKGLADKKAPSAFDVATNLVGSPLFTEEDAKNFSGLIKAKFGSDTDKMNLIMKMLDNQRVPEQVVRSLYNDVSQGHKEGNISDNLRKKVVEKTIKHRNLPRDTFFQLYDETKDMYPSKIEVGKPFNPALVNPRFGGELFRSLPLNVPKEVPNVDKSKLVTKATHGEKSEKIRQVLQLIPPEGIAWPQFKKVAPKLENVPEIKQMFMAKNNKPVKPEDVIAEMRKYAPDEYHVTYTKWNGLQRHLQDDRSSPPNLVVQLNTSASMESKLNQDPKLWNFFQYVQKSANHVHNDQIGGHPVTPHIASWVRVDTSGGKDGWVIEEFQSDFSAKLRKQLKHIFSDRSTIDLDGQKYTQDETNQMVKHIEKTFSSWVDASYQAVEELARKHGVKRLFVHGQGVRRRLSHVSQDKHVEVFDEAYERQPQKRGFKAVQYTDYPKYSKSMAERVVANLSPEEKIEALKCWMKELT